MLNKALRMVVDGWRLSDRYEYLLQTDDLRFTNNNLIEKSLNVLVEFYEGYSVFNVYHIRVRGSNTYIHTYILLHIYAAVTYCLKQYDTHYIILPAQAIHVDPF